MTARMSVLLHDYRTKRELNQRDLASMLDISQQAYANLERGVALPRKGTLNKLAQVTGYSREELNRAKVAQYEWNLSGTADTGVKDEGKKDEGKSAAPVGALDLVAKLSGALARGGLKPYQVAALNVMVDSYLVGAG